MTRAPLTFAKIIATPTDTEWSQAYNAGNLAAVVSLVQSPIENPSEEEEPTLSLSSMGKDVLNTFESEYFTLENKNLQTIKQAIQTTVDKVTGPITLSFILTVILQNVLYVFVYGKGKVLLKRKDKLGTLLHGAEEEKLTAASGYIQHNDIVVLETEQFARIVPTDSLLPALEHDAFADLAETLSPVIHEKHEGSASAIAFAYHEETEPTSDYIEPVAEEIHHEKTESHTSFPAPTDETEQELHDELVEDTPLATHAATRHTRSFPRLSHPRRLILTIAIIIVIVLIGSIFTTIQKQKQQQIESLYQTTVIPAQKKYDEGKSLMDLNKNVAREDFQAAKDMLDTADTKFPADSQQAKQLSTLKQQIDAALTEASAIQSVDAKQLPLTTSDFLNVLSKQSNYAAATEDTKNVYVLSATAVTSVSKSTNTEKAIVKNAKDWTNGTAIGTYLGNFYLLDTSSGILKFVPSGSSYAKSNYFTSGVTPDVSKATSLAIDGSIWVLSSDGTILKFTKGKQDDLSIKGLDKPMSNATRIVTSVDMNNIYIMDNGNSRLVVFDKTGNYIAQYQAPIIGQAKEMIVDEKNKKVDFLSGGNIYEIELK